MTTETTGRRTPPPDFSPHIGDRVIYRGKLAEYHGDVCPITALHPSHFQVEFPDGSYGVVMNRPGLQEFEIEDRQ